MATNTEDAGSWVIPNWNRTKGWIIFPTPLKVGPLRLELATKHFSVPSPLGITVRAKPSEMPDGKFKLDTTFTLPPTEDFYRPATVSRTISLAKGFPSDTVYFEGLLSNDLTGRLADFIDSDVLTIEYRVALSGPDNSPKVADKSRVTPPPRRLQSSSGRVPHVGLENQGATCYMNSVLQSLFHIPLFRRIVYDMPTQDVVSKSDSIPLNLQALFFNMQTRGETCRTRDLTVSFGWGSIESFQQHDIQEFLRVLIENIENKLAGTEHKDAIANLLRGTQQHTIRSRDRLFKHKGSEFFYDLSLQVKDLANLHDSLARSIRPERLDDLYDAGEGFGRIRVEVQVKLLELPKVLQLHLKRFEYDFHSLTQVKVDDRFEFPEQLNMASYLARKAPPQCSMYQLFGVLVHYGTAIGGHYYAYLRPNCGAKWFKFNDSLVTEADSQKAIRENFGGDLYGSRTTYFSYQKIYSAYMLFYVRNDAVSEVFCPVSDDLPAHIKKYADERWGVLGTRTITGMNRFSVYTERGLKQNVIGGMLGFWSKEGGFSIVLSEDSNQEDLYKAISEQLLCDVACLRVWLMENSSLDYIILPDPQKVRLIRTKRLFAQIKDQGEKVEVRGQFVVFVKWYTRTARPLIYTGTVTVDSRATIEALADLVKAQLKLPNRTRVDLFLEDAPLLKILCPMFNCTYYHIKGGSAIVVQPAEPLPEEVVAKFAESAVSDDSVISYYSLMCGRAPETVTEYLKMTNPSIQVDLFEYTTLEPTFVVRVPTSITFENLVKFVALACSLTVDNERQSLLLFPTVKGKRRPAATPMLAVPITGFEFSVLFYHVVDCPVGGRCSTVVVDFSENGCVRSKRRAIYTQSPISIKQIRDAVGDLVSNIQVRILEVRNHKIKRIVSEASVLSTDASYRVEIIPEDQIGVPERELVQVVEVAIDTINYYVLKGFPFFLKMQPDTTIEAVREVIRARRGLTPEVMSHLRFVVPDLRYRSEDITFHQFCLNEVLRKEAKMGNVIRSPNDILLMVRGGDVVSTRGDSIKLNN